MTDRAFWKSFSMMIAALVALTVVLVILANAIGGKTKIKVEADTKQIAERIKPVGEVTLAAAVVEAVIPSANAAGDAGQKLYNQSCAACHVAGVAGAPKFGDKKAWAPRIATGKDKLLQSVLKGKGAMPPRAGTTAAEADIKAAIDYMVSKAQ